MTPTDHPIRSRPQAALLAAILMLTVVAPASPAAAQDRGNLPDEDAAAQAELARRLEKIRIRSLDLDVEGEDVVRRAVASLREHAVLRVPLLADGNAGLSAERVTIQQEAVVLWDAMQQLAEQVGGEWSVGPVVAMLTSADRRDRYKEVRLVLAAGREETMDPRRAAHFAALVRRLGDPDFETRNAAHRELELAGPDCLPWVRRGLESDDAEVRLRCKALAADLRGRDFRPDPMPAYAKSWLNRFERPSTVAWTDVPLPQAVAQLCEERDIPMGDPAGAPDGWEERTVTLHGTASGRVLLEAAVAQCGLHYGFGDRTLRIGVPEALREAVDHGEMLTVAEINQRLNQRVMVEREEGTWADVVEDMAKASDVPIRIDERAMDAAEQECGGWTFNGPLRTHLDYVTRRTNLQWEVVEGGIRIW